MREASILFWCAVFIGAGAVLHVTVLQHWAEIKAALAKRWHG
jgi:hypothetical protein